MEQLFGIRLIMYISITSIKKLIIDREVIIWLRYTGISQGATTEVVVT